MARLFHRHGFASACAVLLGALWAAPVSAQQADLGVTIGAFDELFGYGGSTSVEITVANAGPGNAHDAVVTVTLPAGVEADAPPCEEGATELVWTCDLGEIADGENTVVDFPVIVTVPTPARTTCPAVTGEPVGDLAVAVTANPTASPDPNAANNADTAEIAVGPFADLEVAVVDVPANTSEGQLLAWAFTVTNNGPCAAENVIVDESTSGLLDLQSVAGACTAYTEVDPDDHPSACVLGDIASGASQTFTATYRVGSYSEEMQAGAVSAGAGVSSDTWDQDPDNDSASSQSRLDLDDGGCSSGGAGGLVALVPLALLALRRRRAA